MEFPAPDRKSSCRWLALAILSAVAFLHQLVAPGFTLAQAVAVNIAPPDALARSEAKPTTKTVSASAPSTELATCPPSPGIYTPRTLDEVWLVSSRGLGCPDCEPSPPALRMWQFDLASDQWNESTLAAFFAAQNPSKPDVFWVHGNRVEPGEDREQGLAVYHQLTAGAPADRPIRFVIYSWPTSPIHGLVEDAREKAARTNTDGYYLAWLISQIDHRVPVNLIGYSFGARIVTGALHVLAGGSLFGHMLEKPAPHRPMQVVLVAAAVNNDWLAIGRPHGRALESVDRMLALNNGCDRALKHYGAIDPCNRPEALGYTGALGPFSDDNGQKLREVEMCCAVGKEHNWRSYFYNPSIVARMRPYVGLAPD
jgi:hypothetical protein